jgi:hypothetical protein
MERLLNEGAALRFESQHLAGEFRAGHVSKTEFVARKSQIVVDMLAIAQEIHRLTSNQPTDPTHPPPLSTADDMDIGA